MAQSVQQERVFKRWDYAVHFLLSALSLATIIVFFRRWFSVDSSHALSIPYLTVTALLLYNLSINQFRWFLLLMMRRPKPMPVGPGWRVGVATTFVPGVEPIEMLEKTVAAMVAMDYPHDVWVLDEADDIRVQDLCHRLGANYFSRKHRPEYQTSAGIFAARTKHGNYNAWFDDIGYSRYDILVGMDPDHTPLPGFLEETLGYFADPKIGYVQAAQVYYNQEAGFIARGAAEETYSYYSATQMAGFAMGYPIVVGCHQLHRRTALQQVGGFAYHDADDLLITMLYRAAGWQGVYTPKVLAKGLTPTDWNGYLAQQLRWARSVIDIKLRHYPKASSSYPPITRLISFLHGLSYIQEGIVGFAVIVQLALMLAAGLTFGFLSPPLTLTFAAMYAVLQLEGFYMQRFFLDPRREKGLHWRAAFLRFAKWPYIFLGLADAVSGKKRGYAITPKVKGEARQWMIVWPHLIIAATLALGWGIGVARGVEHDRAVLLWSAVMALGSLLCVWSGFWKYSDPFDLQLWKRQFLPPDHAWNSRQEERVKQLVKSS